jgi:hypothetical protein
VLGNQSEAGGRVVRRHAGIAARLRAVAAVGLGALAALAGAAAPAARAASPLTPAQASSFFGASGGIPSDPSQLDQLRSAGVSTYRTDASWGTAEPQAPVGGVHSYQWDSLDSIATTLARHNLRWYPILDYSAPWASAGPSPFYAPGDAAQFSAYAAAFAARFGPGGSFWAAHPELPNLPTQQYEIWNEANNPTFWADQTDAPARFADLMLSAHEAIHAVQPGATVVLGGLLDAGTDALSFLSQMQAARPGVLAHMDAIGYHPYQGDLGTIESRMAALRTLLRGAGATNVPIEVTEIDSNHAFSSPADWTATLTRISTELAGGSCGVLRFMVYMANPEQTQGQDFDSSGWYTLFRSDGSLSTPGQAYLSTVQSLSRAPAPADSLCKVPATSRARAASTKAAATRSAHKSKRVSARTRRARAARARNRKRRARKAHRHAKHARHASGAARARPATH